MVFLIVLSLLVVFTKGEDCNIREYEYGTVCACNATYCDTVPALDVSPGYFQLYSSSKSKIGFYSTTGSFSSDTSDVVTINVNESSQYQTIIGFGGAFTDAAGINIASLPEGAQEKLLESYFGDTGVGYSLCRVPIGGTDFSLRGYSYDDTEDDITLENFALQQEDYDYKIPYILKANELRKGSLSLFGSAWSAPLWMKTNNDWPGIGILKDEYYQLWADYIVRFLEEYEQQNISFWGITTQNEPFDGFIPKSISQINAMGWLPSQMNKWVGLHLGPTIRSSAFNSIKIILHDESRLSLPLFSLINLKNNLTVSYADGVAVHWYTNSFTSASWLDLVKTDKEGWFFISSEACNGFTHVAGIEAVEKGSWLRAENYIGDILDNLEYGAGGWVDWNMVLNETGGPTYIDNLVDAPVLVNHTLQEFYKQPMYYGLGHFSKFIVPGSVRLDTTFSEDLSNVRAAAFLRPDNLTALIIYNSGFSDVNVRIRNGNSQSAVVFIEARSINTALYE